MKNLHKHLSRIAKESNNLEILRGVEFNAGTCKINATDSYRLLSYNYDGETVINKVINLKTLEVLKGIYPNVSRLIPANYGTKLSISYGDITKEHISLLTKNKSKILKMGVSSKIITISVPVIAKQNRTFEELFTIKLKSSDNEKFKEVIHVNAEYLRDCLEFMLDYKKCHSEKDFSLNVLGAVRPILFKGEEFSYLITPVRTTY